MVHSYNVTEIIALYPAYKSKKNKAKRTKKRVLPMWEVPLLTLIYGVKWLKIKLVSSQQRLCAE